MRVVLLRHGKAVDGAPTDGLRWLTAEGRAQVQDVGAAFTEAGLRFTDVRTSPLVRAVQTAEIIAAATGYRGEVRVHPTLAPDEGTTAQALAPLDAVDADAALLLVGHEPRVRLMAGNLLGLPGFPSFRTASACLLELVAGGSGARFIGMLDPATRGWQEHLERPG